MHFSLKRRLENYNQKPETQYNWIQHDVYMYLYSTQVTVPEHSMTVECTTICYEERCGLLCYLNEIATFLLPPRFV